MIFVPLVGYPPVAIYYFNLSNCQQELGIDFHLLLSMYQHVPTIISHVSQEISKLHTIQHTSSTRGVTGYLSTPHKTQQVPPFPKKFLLGNHLDLLQKKQSCPVRGGNS